MNNILLTVKQQKGINTCGKWNQMPLSKHDRKKEKKKK
jgi:hypothetical protein